MSPHQAFLSSDSEHAAGPADLADRRRCRLAVICLFAASIVLGELSNGSYHDDDLTHYLMARWSWWYPEYLLHIWGRPGATVPLACVAGMGDRWFGWHMARALSALATAASAVIAAHLARKLGVKKTWIVVVACYAQPLAMVLSYTTLTENWTALYLIAAVALLHARRTIQASTVFSLALVTRHEVVALLPIWWLALAMAPTGRSRKQFGAIAALWAPTLHNVLFWLVFQEWPVRIFFEPGGSTEFKPAGILAYLPQAAYAISPVILSLSLFRLGDWLRRDRWAVAAIPAMFFLVQCAAKSFGLFASGGYGRFMVAVSPFVAILASHGLQEVESETLSGKHGVARLFQFLGLLLLLTWLGIEIEARAGRLYGVRAEYVLLGRLITGLLVAALILAWIARAHVETALRRRVVISAGVLLMAIQWVVVVRPLRLRESEQRCVAVARWVREQQRDQGPLFVTHPWVAFELGMVEHPRAHKGRHLLASMPVGTTVIWDSKYTSSDFHGIDLGLLSGRAYHPIRTFFDAAEDKGVCFGAVEKTQETLIPALPEQSYPRDLTASRLPITGIYYQVERQGEVSVKAGYTKKRHGL